MSEDDIKANVEEEVLKQIDASLEQEDPEFTKDLTSIEIDNTACMMMDEYAVETPDLSEADFFSKENILRTIDFKNNRRAFVMFWSSVLMVVFTIYFAFQTRLWDWRWSLYMTSFKDLKIPITEYNPINDTQYFFDNPRLSKNFIELKKIFVNLKPSADSGDNPMLAFSITVEGLSREVVVELKDRESEFVDLAARVAEEFSYDELVTTDGKIYLSEKIADAYNAGLTTGQVRKVMYSTFILKN